MSEEIKQEYIYQADNGFGPEPIKKNIDLQVVFNGNLDDLNI